MFYIEDSFRWNTLWTFEISYPNITTISMSNNMNEIKKDDIKQEVFDLYDDYAHNRIERRDFMEKLSAYAVGGLTVASLMSFLMPDYKGAIQVQANDPKLKSEYINYPSPKGGGSMKALLSKPADAKKKAGWHCGCS